MINDENMNSELELLKQKIERLEKEHTEQKKIITALKESDHRYQSIFNNANDGIILHDLEGNILDVNPHYYQRLGYSKKQMLKMKLQELVIPEFGEKIKSRVNDLKETGIAIFKSADKRKDGTLMPVEVSARLLNFNKNQIIQSIVRDISDRKLAEDLIEKTLIEKNLLLEGIWQCTTIHHMIITHTLETISKKADIEEIKAVLTATQQRLEAIGFIQNKINRIKNISKINMDDIIRSLLVHLHMLYRVGSKKIQIHREVEYTGLNILQASPCIFIINELLSNSFKHAFPDGREGKIIVKLVSVQKGSHILSVLDDGIGLNNDFNINRPESIGFQIVHNMNEQLKGKMEIKKEKGTEIIINF